jgi:proteasome assembly chaperone (PAC2) family protein
MKRLIISEELRNKIITIINNGVFSNIRHGEVANVVGELLRAETTEGIEVLEEQLDQRDKRIEELVGRLAEVDEY